MKRRDTFPDTRRSLLLHRRPLLRDGLDQGSRCFFHGLRRDSKGAKHTSPEAWAKMLRCHHPYRDWDESQSNQKGPKMNQTCLGTTCNNQCSTSPRGATLSMHWSTSGSQSIPQIICQSMLGPISEPLCYCGPPPRPLAATQPIGKLFSRPDFGGPSPAGTLVANLQRPG